MRWWRSNPPKKRQHALWQSSCALALLDTKYSILLRVSHLARSAHLRRVRWNVSNSRNSRPDAVIPICASLIQAYNGAPNRRTDVTNDVASCNLTLQFVSPSSYALFLMRWKAILACFSLASIICTGFLADDVISIPRYLNTEHCFNLTLLTYRSPEHCTSMTTVLLVLMTKSFSPQNLAKIDTSYCSLATLGAIRTRSSAKDSIKILTLATANSLHYYLV